MDSEEKDETFEKFCNDILQTKSLLTLQKQRLRSHILGDFSSEPYDKNEFDEFIETLSQYSLYTDIII